MIRRRLIQHAAGAVAIAMSALTPSAALADPPGGTIDPPGTPDGPQLAPGLGTEVRANGAPPTVTPDDIRFQPRRLRAARPAEVGLLPEQIERMRADLAAYLAPTPDHPTFPTYSGAVALAAKDGGVVLREAVGLAVRYSSVGPAPGRVGVELPADRRIPAATDTIFDLASISKLFTTIVLMQQVEAGRVDLDAPVVRYLPEFAAGGKQDVTVRHLLTHTSGLPAFRPLYSLYPTPAERLAGALATPVTAGSSPGNQYVYSDLGLIALGVIIERVTGRSLDDAVHVGITGPLSMLDTRYNPGADLRPRIAATEYQGYVNRGLVWGEVHDENAWSLGGVAGHAGLFSTVDDLAVLCQTLLGGGEYRGRRILRAETIRRMLVNYNAHLEPTHPDSDRGLGFELNKHSYMGALASPVTFGHTGFTGTSIVVDPLAHTFLILLSNRVHPDRGWGTNTVARQALARDLDDARPVRPLLGGTAWRTDRRSGATVTLTAPLRSPVTGHGLATFLTWYDTEPRFDTVRFEGSVDGGATWAPISMAVRSPTRPGNGWTAADGVLTGFGGRRWWYVSARLAAGTTHVRWSYATNASAQGRGGYVDHVVVLGNGRTLFHGDGADRARFVADGWSPATT